MGERASGTALLSMGELDEFARHLLENNNARALVGHADELVSRQLAGHPLATVLAAAACSEAHRGDPRARELLDAAWEDLKVSDDAQALGLAANVRANVAMARGGLEEAVRWWRQSAELLPETTPATAHVLANLSIDAFLAGDLSNAVERAEAARAAASGDPYELIPVTYLAAYTLWLGELTRCERWLDRAEELCDDPGSGAKHDEQVMVHAIRGGLHSLRGMTNAAEAAFARAVALAEQLPGSWYLTIALVKRAQSLAEWAPQRSIDDAQRARRDAEDVGDRWWEAMAALAEGIAWRTIDPARSAAEIHASLRLLDIPLERARAQLALGETYLWQGNRRAAQAPLLMARVTFSRAGARYYEARTCARLAEAEPREADRWFEPARAGAAEPAFRRLLDGVALLEVDLEEGPRVCVGGRRVDFLTRHAELVVRELVAAGPDGLEATRLAETLWPSAARSRRPPRLRTALWQVRTALGPHAWRIQRRGDRVSFDLTGVVVHRSRGLTEWPAAVADFAP